MLTIIPDRPDSPAVGHADLGYTGPRDSPPTGRANCYTGPSRHPASGRANRYIGLMRLLTVIPKPHNSPPPGRANSYTGPS